MVAKGALSVESQALLDADFQVCRLYLAELKRLRSIKFKIEIWDAGWWQILNALSDGDLGEGELYAVKGHSKLKEKLLPQIYTLRFLN